MIARTFGASSILLNASTGLFSACLFLVERGAAIPPCKVLIKISLSRGGAGEGIEGIILKSAVIGT
jgi:hypothetical protein